LISSASPGQHVSQNLVLRQSHTEARTLGPTNTLAPAVAALSVFATRIRYARTAILDEQRQTAVSFEEAFKE
jgi:hypothetical protein